jgi:hypothetical protein
MLVWIWRYTQPHCLPLAIAQILPADHVLTRSAIAESSIDMTCCARPALFPKVPSVR